MLVHAITIGMGDSKRLKKQVISYIDIVLTLTSDSVSSYASFY